MSRGIELTSLTKLIESTTRLNYPSSCAPRHTHDTAARWVVPRRLRSGLSRDRASDWTLKREGIGLLFPNASVESLGREPRDWRHLGLCIDLAPSARRATSSYMWQAMLRRVPGYDVSPTAESDLDHVGATFDLLVVSSLLVAAVCCRRFGLKGPTPARQRWRRLGMQSPPSASEGLNPSSGPQANPLAWQASGVGRALGVNSRRVAGEPCRGDYTALR